VKLVEHPDFAALLVATAQATGLNEQFVEKDYYVTEVLRIVADAYRVNLASANTNKRRVLYLLDKQHALRFLGNRRAIASVLSKSASVQAKFRASHQDDFATVREYWATVAIGRRSETHAAERPASSGTPARASSQRHHPLDAPLPFQP
jgi:hypothetical protein